MTIFLATRWTKGAEMRPGQDVAEAAVQERAVAEAAPDG